MVFLDALVWFPLTVGLCLACLPSAKGALVGLQWALRMHGFGEAHDDAELAPAIAPSLNASRAPTQDAEIAAGPTT